MFFANTVSYIDSSRGLRFRCGRKYVQNRRTCYCIWSSGFGDLWFYLLVDASDLEKVNSLKKISVEITDSLLLFCYCAA